MLFNSLILLLLSNSITSRRDKSTLYSRSIITILMISGCTAYYNFSILFLAKGIDIFGGLLHTTANTNSFHIFIFLIISVILLLTSFYPRRVWYISCFKPNRILFTKFIYYENLLLKKMGQQFNKEYSLITLFIVTINVFLISTNDLVSIFLFITLKIYGLYLLSTIYRDSEPDVAGDLIYFILGELSFCFILLGTALFHANYATTSLNILYIIIIIIYIVYLIQCFTFVELPSPHSFHSPCYLSGFSGDKGKGKAKDDYKQDTAEKNINKQNTDKHYQDEEDLDFMRDIERAKLNSLGLKGELSKKGESSAMGAKSYSYDTSSDLNNLKSLKVEAVKKSIEYNTLKQEFIEGGATECFTDEILNPFKEKYFSVKKEINIIKQRLSNKGINVESETEQSEYYSEDSEEENYSDDDTNSSSSEENTRVKRIKFSDDNNNKTFFVLPITYDFLYFLSPVLNMFFLVIFGIILYLIKLDIIPNLSVSFITLTQLISLHLFINILRLMHKNYHTAVKLYNAYLKKDYFMIYSNIYLTSILILFYLNSNFDIGIFYC